MVLLWRAIVRQTHDVIRRQINPTTVAGSVLSEEDAKQIAQTEQNEGRLKAVDQLVYKLLKLKNLRLDQFISCYSEAQAFRFV